jgi:hypothetical protein
MEKDLSTPVILLKHKFEGAPTQCPVCGEGQYIGLLLKTCTNINCPWFVAFCFELCHICQQPRYNCCC